MDSHLPNPSNWDAVAVVRFHGNVDLDIEPTVSIKDCTGSPKGDCIPCDVVHRAKRNCQRSCELV